MLGNPITKAQWSAVGPLFTTASGEQFRNEMSASSAKAFQEIWAGMWNWKSGWQDTPLKVSESGMNTFIELLGSSDPALSSLARGFEKYVGWWKLGRRLNYLRIEFKRDRMTVSFYRLGNSFLATGEMALEQEWEVKEGALRINPNQKEIQFVNPDTDRDAVLTFSESHSRVSMKFKGIRLGAPISGQPRSSTGIATKMSDTEMESRFYFP